MLENGYIRLHRSLLTWEWYGDVNVTRVFLHLLMTANYQDKTWRGITVKRGQRIISAISLAAETGLTRQEIRTALTKLLSTNEITCVSTNAYTLVTIVKYGFYQSDEGIINQQSNQRNNTPTTNEQPTINHNVKKKKRNKETSCPGSAGRGVDEEEEKRPRHIYEHESKYYKAASWLRDKVLKNTPRRMQEPTEAILQTWADTIRLMESSDNLPWDEIRETLKWAVNHYWWKSRILSAVSFRKGYNKLAAQMASEPSKQKGPNEDNASAGSGFANAADIIKQQEAEWAETQGDIS